MKAQNILKTFPRFNSLLIITFCFLLWGCAARKPDKRAAIKVKFLDEYIIPKDLIINDTQVGGLSDIDYDGQYYYAVCDLPSAPRIYKFNIDIDHYKIDSVRFSEVIRIPQQSYQGKSLRFDAEGLAFDKNKQVFILSSEGLIHKNKDPFIVELNQQGEVISQYQTSDYFKADYPKGLRNNGVFEGLDISQDQKGIWVSTELPLKMDGPESKIFKSNSPVRFTYYNRQSKQAERQFAYPLDRLRKLPYFPYGLNGVSAIVEYKPERFLVLERAFSAGHGRHSFRVRLFDVDARNTTNTLHIKNLSKQKSITYANKKLIFDFNTIKKELTHRAVDNLEGITFGPKLPNGHQSLIIMADNNFSSFVKEMNQVILLEIIP